MIFPYKYCERKLEVIHGEDNDLLLPLPESVALSLVTHLPADQTRLKIKDINLIEICNLLGDFPVVDGQNAY